MMKRRNFIRNTLAGTIGISAIPKSLKASETSSTIINEIPVIEETDICVLGGSCTGVFAAIRAARLGAKVSIIEKQNAFGGVATNSMVFIWHSLLNTESDKQIISGLTEEVINRLKKRNSVVITENSPSAAFRFNSQELKIELDEMILEHNITPHFHTLFSEPVVNEKDEVEGVILDSKDGRGIIKAKFFIDATGDGDLCQRLNIHTFTDKHILPPTTGAHFEGWNDEIQNLINKHGEEFDIPEGFLWGNNIPNSKVTFIAGTRVYDVDCSKTTDLTKAEIEGRRQIRAINDLVRKYQPENNLILVGLPSQIGIRQTRQVKCQYRLTGEDVLYGRHFEDAIAYGSYRVDIHHSDKPGITLRYLNGWEEYSRPGFPVERKRWRAETETNPTYYQIPFRSIVPNSNFKNVIVAGRMFDADLVAFSGARVMVNMNQLGEAAGTAAWIATNKRVPLFEIESNEIRELMKKGGSIIL